LGGQAVGCLAMWSLSLSTSSFFLLPPSSLYFLVLILFVSFCDFFSYFDIKKNREMNPAKTSFQDLTFFNRVSPFDALCALV
jgi:hypothetical protein